MKQYLFSVIIMIMSFLCIACGKENLVGDENKKTDLSEKNLTMIMGGAEEREIVLDADKVPDFSLDMKYVNEIEKLINGEKEYKNEHEKFMEQIEDITKDKDFCLYGEKKVNISMFPVFEWSAEENEIIYSYPSIIVFSKDYEKAACFELILEDGRYKSYSYRDMDTKFLTTLKENRNKDFVFLGVYEQEELLSSENELTEINGMNSNSVKIKGDYYLKLKKSGMIISMRKLTEKIKTVNII